MFPELLLDCAAKFGEPPRRFYPWTSLFYLQIPRPDWFREVPDDELKVLFQNLGTLYRNGKVVWAHLVQANVALFEPGTWDAPAEFVYSLNDDKISPEELGKIAHALFSLKGTTPNHADQAPLAEYLTNERTRTYGKPVPRSLSPRFACQVSTTYVIRKHLPGPRHALCQSFLPMIVNPIAPHVALPLPSKYWPEALIHWWAA